MTSLEEVEGSPVEVFWAFVRKHLKLAGFKSIAGELVCGGPLRMAPYRPSYSDVHGMTPEEIESYAMIAVKNLLADPHRPDFIVRGS